MSEEKMSEVLRFQIRSQNVLSPDETELFELAQLAGVTMDPKVFKIILDLLKLNVAPMAIVQMLKMLCDPQQQKSAVDVNSLNFLSGDSSALHAGAHNRSGRSRHDGKLRQSSSSSRLKDGRH